MLELSIIYFSIGIIFSWFGPLAKKVNSEKFVIVGTNPDISSLKLFFIEAILRLGIILLYPVFLISEMKHNR